MTPPGPLRRCIQPLAVAAAIACFVGCGGGALPRVLISTDLGDMAVEIEHERAPVTAGNFLRYVDEHRFVGATFYRVVTMLNQPENSVKIEVIQGGLLDDDPQALPPIPHETTAQTGLLHRDGTISMARLEPGSASSEFFVCIGDQPELDHRGRRNSDGQGFAAFGRVIEGMDVVRAIQRGAETGQMLDKPVRIVSVERID